MNSTNQSNAAAIAQIKRRQGRLRLWLLLFVLMMPLGCIGPFSLFRLIPNDQVKLAFGAAGLLLPFVGLGGTILMFSDRHKCKRPLALAGQADKMGLLFIEKPPRSYHDVLRHFQSFALADSVTVTNLLTGEMGGVTVSVIDYFIAAGSARYASVAQQTIVFLPRLPQAYLNFSSIQKVDWFGWRRLSPKSWVGLIWSFLTTLTSTSSSFYLARTRRRSSLVSHPKS